MISRSGELQQGYFHGSLTEGLVAYYPMEKGEGEILHDGALNNLGQINGANWKESGQVGSNSLNFDASNIDKVNANELDPFIQAPFSISFWIKPESMGDQVIFDHDGRLTISTGTPPTGTTGNDEIGFGIYDGSSWNNILTGSKSSGSWYHIISTYDGTNMQLYVNGSKVGTNTSSKLATKNEGTEFGARGTDDSYDGLIDDFRIYNRILSQPEIKALYNLSQSSGRQITENKVPDQNQDGLSRYKFNGNVKDSWGTKDGTKNTSAGFVNGIYGQSKDFGGSGDINIPAVSSLNAFTASVWFKAENDSYLRMFQLFENNGLILEIDGNKEAQFRLDDSAGNVVLTAPQTPGEWHHLVASWDGSKMRHYLNGSLTGEASQSENASQSGADVIGSTGSGSRLFKGQLDDLRLYTKALSPQQVEKLYNLGAYRIPRRSTLQ